MKKNTISAIIKFNLAILFGLAMQQNGAISTASAQSQDMSKIHLNYQPPAEGGTVATLKWTASPIGFYEVQRSADLVNWQSIGSASGPALTPHMTDSTRSWNGIASSYDGSRLVAPVYGGYIYTSTDFGTTWLQRTSSGVRYWNYVASDYTGAKLVATVVGGYIYTSPDSGATWNARTSAGARSWVAVASSSDGVKLVAIVNQGSIWRSQDSGATWLEVLDGSGQNWTSITSNSNGVKLAATVNGGSRWISLDSGATWTRIPNPLDGVVNGIDYTYSYFWSSITSDASGNNLISVAYAGSVYKSTDSGQTWNDLNYWSVYGAKSLSMSADGVNFIMIADSSSRLLISQDFGITGYYTTGPFTPNRWIQVVLSGDGKRIIAIENNGYIYTSKVGEMSFDVFEQSQGFGKYFYRLFNTYNN